MSIRQVRENSEGKKFLSVPLNGLNRIEQQGINVVETWRSEDNSLGYRKGSDGWIEQGGTIAGTSTYSEQIITFVVPFQNVPDAVFVTTIAPALNYNGTGSETQRGAYAIAAGVKYITGTNFSTASFYEKNWYACGLAAN